MNVRCDECGKFRRIDDLIRHFTPDNSFNGEDAWSQCLECFANIKDLHEMAKKLKTLKSYSEERDKK